jgi:Tfp pilus assembly protein PilX
MVILYVALLVLLCGARYLIQRRATSLERKYAAVLKQASALLREPLSREGNSGRTDPYQTAKRSYQLGALAQKKEALEARHGAWRARAEKLGRMIRAVRAWKGRKFPYLVGALDAFAGLCLLDYLGLSEYASPHQVVNTLTTWLSS